MTARLFVILALTLPGLLPAPSLKAEPALLIVEGADAAGLRALKAQLENAGARLPHLLPPDVLLGDVPSDLLASVSLPAELSVRLVSADDALALRVQGGLSRSARSAHLRAASGLVSSRAPISFQLPPSWRA